MTGGTPGDTDSDRRAVVPLRARALDRLVSVQDYADFAAAHAGLGKAASARLFDGRREVVQVTIAAIDDVPLAPGDLLVETLERTLAALGDPHLPVRVDLREELWLVLSAGLKVGADHLFEDVEPRVRSRLLEVAGFDGSALAEPVHLSRLVAEMQRTAGVEHVDVDVFGALPGRADPVQLLTAVTALGGVTPRIPVHPARYVADDYVVGHDPTGDEDTLSTVALRFGLTVPDLVRLNPRLRSTRLTDGQRLAVARGLHPAQLACFNPEVPQTLILRSIP
jgi:hypothetical protein